MCSSNVLVGIHLVCRIVGKIRWSSESNGAGGNLGLLVRQCMFRCVRALDLRNCDIAVKKARDWDLGLIFSLKDLDSGASISAVIIDLCLHDA